MQVSQNQSAGTKTARECQDNLPTLANSVNLHVCIFAAILPELNINLYICFL